MYHHQSMTDDDRRIIHLLKMIEKSIDKQQWRTVKELAEQILTIDPDNSDAIARLNTAQRRQDDFLKSEDRVPSPIATQQEKHSADSFIGRKTVLSQLELTLDRVVAENGQMDMIVGEPGIGKSRLAEEVSSYAEQNDVRVLSGRCYEERGAPPYWPWVQVVRSYLAEAEPEELAETLGPRASLVATIFPEINEYIPDLRTFEPGTQNPESVRFRLFDAVTTFFIDISNSKPTLLVLDDLHWADESSLKLLVFLARELKRSHLFVLGAYRDVELDRKHPLSDSLGELTRERLFERHRLKGFILPEVQAYAHAVSGVWASEQLIGTVFELTNGNPLFVSQMTRLLAQDNELRDEGGAQIRLPEGVREVIGRRLNRLSQECNDVLTVASIFGLEFRLRELILTVGEESTINILGALDDAEKAHFIERAKDGVDLYRFGHALVRETLVSEVTLSRGVRLHAKIFNVLEELYADNLKIHADRLAEHAAQAETVLGTERLANYSLLAGESAMAKHAYEEALRHFERGLTALEDSPLDEKKAALLLGKGNTLTSLLRREEAFEAFSTAMDFYEKIGDAKHAAIIGELQYPYSNVGTTLCERALNLIPPESLEAGRILSHYGCFLMKKIGSDVEYAKKQMQRALRIAEKHDDENLKTTTHAHWAGASWYLMRTDDCHYHCLQAIESSIRASDRQQEARARGWLIDVLGVQGKMADARQQLRIIHRIALESGERSDIWTYHHYGTNLAIYDGDWSTARRHSDAVLSIVSDFAVLGCRACVEYESGNFEEGRRYLNMFTDLVRSGIDSPHSYSFGAYAIIRASRISGNMQYLELADEWGRRGLESLSRAPIGEKLSKLAIGTVSILRGDLEEAKTYFDELIAEANDISGGASLYAMLRFGEFFGLYARALGRLDEAADHLRKTIAAIKNQKPRSAWLFHDLAVTLLQRSQQGDVAEAKDLLKEALATAVHIGMPPLEKRIREALERISTPDKVSYPSNLTQREVEVIRQLSIGKTNQEIADLLFISVRTVDRHITNILRKTGTGNRTEAANFAIKHGLTVE